MSEDTLDAWKRPRDFSPKWKRRAIFWHWKKKVDIQVAGGEICFFNTAAKRRGMSFIYIKLRWVLRGSWKGQPKKQGWLSSNDDKQCFCSKVPNLTIFQELTFETCGNQPCLLFPILTRKRSVSLLKSSGISQGAKRVKRFRPEIWVSHAWVKDGSMCKGVIAPAAPIKSQWKSSGVASGWENME